MMSERTQISLAEADSSEELERLRSRVAELEQSEERLRLAIEMGRIGLWVWDSTDTSNEGDWSERLKEIFGLPLDAEVTHDMFLKCVHGEDRELIHGKVMGALAGVDEGRYTAEYRTIRADDGREGWVMARGQAFFDGSGKAVRFIGTVTDITERKRAEEALAKLNGELEGLAYGQAEALKHALTMLSRESEPDRFLDHVLRMIGRQFAAHSLGVWELNEVTERVELLASCEGEVVRLVKEDKEQGAPRFAPPVRENGVWTTFFATAEHCILGDLESEMPRVRLAGVADGEWQEWLGDMVNTEEVRTMLRVLTGKGVKLTLGVPMLVGGRVVGFINIRFKEWRVFRDEELGLARALGHQAMLAIQLMRLSMQSRKSAVMAERNRLARDIHDTLAQGFTGVIVQLEASEDARVGGLTEAADAHVTRARELARNSLQEARRSVQALRPQALETQDLCVALSKLFKSMTEGTGLTAKFELRGKPRKLVAEVECNLLRIVQEVLTNVLRHAQATRFEAILFFEEEELRLELEDDGLGFDVLAVHEGFGLTGMRERVEAMGGEMTLASSSEAGTSICIRLPLVDGGGIVG